MWPILQSINNSLYVLFTTLHKPVTFTHITIIIDVHNVKVNVYYALSNVFACADLNDTIPFLPKQIAIYECI